MDENLLLGHLIFSVNWYMMLLTCFRYFDRDVQCIFKFFRKRFVSESLSTFASQNVHVPVVETVFCVANIESFEFWQSNSTFYFCGFWILLWSLLIRILNIADPAIYGQKDANGRSLFPPVSFLYLIAAKLHNASHLL